MLLVLPLQFARLDRVGRGGRPVVDAAVEWAQTSAGLVELDFVDALQDGGFKVKNPNAATSCSCGESFSA